VDRRPARERPLIMLGWLKIHAWWLTIVSALATLAMAAIGCRILVNLPEDYFLRQDEETDSSKPRRAVSLPLSIFKNVLGALIVIIGAIMSLPLVPGPGVITILIGLSLMSFPGKRKLEMRILRTGPVLSGINWLRAQAGKPRLRLSADGSSGK
jgi:hypothetical protein